MRKTMTRMRRSLIGGLVVGTVATSVFAALPSSPASADTYVYCPGYVIQYFDGGGYVAYWYDQNGNWGEVPGPRLNHDLVCGAS